MSRERIPCERPQMAEFPEHRRSPPVKADEVFVQLLTGEQWRLRRYIATLLGDLHAANDVLQETNLLLWRKSHEFRPGSSFFAWARTVAYWQVRAYVRDQRRGRYVFSEELVTQLHDTAAFDVDESGEILALRSCLEQVSPRNLGLLRKRYEERLPVGKIAEQSGKSQSAVKTSLMRIRRALQKCIEQARQVPDGGHHSVRPSTR